MSAPNVKKNTTYRDDLIQNIKDKGRYDSHPISNGIKMQAHHVVSAKGVDLSGAEDQMLKIEYDINEVDNITFIPCTFQGACHLNTQLHRSNHTTKEKKSSDMDDEHPRTYHQTVSDYLDAVYEENKNLCPEKKQKFILNKYKLVSKFIIASINDFEPDTQLTAAYESFDINGNLSKIGCAGKNYMKDHEKSMEVNMCPVGRDHNINNSKVVDSIINPEEIVIDRKEKKYILKLGN